MPCSRSCRGRRSFGRSFGLVCRSSSCIRADLAEVSAAIAVLDVHAKLSNQFDLPASAEILPTFLVRDHSKATL